MSYFNFADLSVFAPGSSKWWGNLGPDLECPLLLVSKQARWCEIRMSHCAETLDHTATSQTFQNMFLNYTTPVPDIWEIVEGLRGGHSNVQEPQKQEGYMLKRRKWPMKGWHKRYFHLDKGILKYAKCCADVDKGKLHGRIDVGLSVMAIKKKSKCIDLDAEENIYHLKIKSQDLFDEWVSKLRHHRLYRQNEITMFPNEKALYHSHFSSPGSPSIDWQSYIPSSFPVTCTSQAKVAAWLQSSDDMDKCSKGTHTHTHARFHCYIPSQYLELSTALFSLSFVVFCCPSLPYYLITSALQNKVLPRTVILVTVKHISHPSFLTTAIRIRVAFSAQHQNADVHDRSNLIFLRYLHPRPPPARPPSVLSLLHSLSLSVHESMKTALGSLTSEKERMRQVMDHPDTPQVMGLKNALSSVTDQNKEHTLQLHRGVFGPGEPMCHNSKDGSHPLVHQVSNESRTSITESLSEFFDAQEVLLSASSSENEASEDDSYISDNVSDSVSMDNFNNEADRDRRRARLPSPSPNTSNISLWNILRNNIGKDLSKVAMPVELNEPLNTLQRLCEELEYSELLDRAANTQDPFERMVYIATFAVSGYASSYHRSGGKPFNPVLGETYECDRPDKGFRFVAEQVSHHPPISACHADSKNFIFWQDMRWKNKFWGKSMEIVPVGTTHVILPGFGDHYEWNKVTSCIHNILSGQRWIEHYGEISIKNSGSDICQCKVTFVKAKYWNSSVNEVEGSITDHKGKVIHRLFGKWNEGMYCGDPPSATCIWRANAMPADHEQYYGFTKFAMELNELDPSLKLLLPPTDTRLRLDQRLLEEGNLEAAEEQKQKIEHQQRDRRKVLDENGKAHQPRFFRKSKEDTWVSNNTYWDLRRTPGFVHMDCPMLW
uniref:Oxysterol-binding protein n=1 Tax=Esox lucius TaxID=8010 RepID=A0A6Q2Z2C3_ESOLU